MKDCVFVVVSLKSSKEKSQDSPKQKINGVDGDLQKTEVTKSSSTNGTDTGAAVNGDLLTEAEEKELMPNTVCGHLQLIFAQLQFSNRRYRIESFVCSYCTYQLTLGDVQSTGC